MDIERLDINRFPLKHEVFARKQELGEEIARRRDVVRRSEAASRRRAARIWICTMAAAAVVAAAIFMLKVVTITTTSLQQTVTLPCGSTIIVAQNSKITYMPHLWWSSRKVELEGSAHFDITHGNSFTVATQCGDVSVLGTVFNVEQQNDTLAVKCFEGRVAVTSADDDIAPVTLNAGEEVTVADGEANKEPIVDEETAIANEDEEEPLTIYYDNEPLDAVVAEMERSLGITVTNKGLCHGITYSGIFYRDNRELTLEIVFMSCGFEYTASGNEITLHRIE